MVNLLEVKNVSYTYRSKYQVTEALKEVSCTFDSRRLYVLRGPSGSGKTTLLSLLAGLDLATEGDVFLRGVSFGKLDREKLRREDVAIIFQAFNLFPLLTAQENVMFPLQISGVTSRKAKNAAAALLQSVGINEEQFGKYPDMLSGGEQQRIAVARALASGAKIILADEPTGSLDSANGQKIMDILKRLVEEEGYCVIVVTHDMTIADQANVIYSLKDGRLLEEGEMRNEAARITVYDGDGLLLK